MNPRVVWITGVGAVSAAGSCAGDIADRVLAGGTGVRHDAEFGGAAGRVNVEPVLPRAARRLDRSARFFFAAGSEAWLAAGLDGARLDPRRCALIEGSSLGPLSDILGSRDSRRNRGPRPSDLITFMTGAGGAALAQTFGIEGSVLHLSAGSISSACAIGEGFQKIMLGQADLVLAGGGECPLHRDVADVFGAAGVLANRDGKGTCRPFDQHRSGTVLGEGAGALVLESAEHARRRGVVPLAILDGYGVVCESHSMTAPNPDGTGVTAAALQALDGTDPKEVGWVKTHGTGTQAGDAAECRGLARLFEGRLPDLPIFSIKPALGHCLGASAAVETVVAVLALQRGQIPPTLDSERMDPNLPDCDLVTSPRPSTARRALVLAESFGGRCAALMIGR